MTGETFWAGRRRDYRREAFMALFSGAIMLFITLAGNWPMLRMVTAVMAVVRLGGALRIFRHWTSLDAMAAHRSGAALEQALRERDSAFLRSIFYWYALPLSIGFVGVGAAMWHYAGSLPLTVACVFLAAGTAWGAWHLNRRKLAELGVR